MRLSHVVIAFVASVENRQAHPADVRFAAPANHMIATLCLLQGCRTSGAIFDIEFPLQVFERLARRHVFVLLAGVVTVLGMAKGANLLGTIRAHVGASLRLRGWSAAIDEAAVWSRAVVKGIRVTLHV